MLNDDFITLTIAKQKSIALIAHDSKKAEMIDCAGRTARSSRIIFSAAQARPRAW